jgi:hypothetical protein
VVIAGTNIMKWNKIPRTPAEVRTGEAGDIQNIIWKAMDKGMTDRDN